MDNEQLATGSDISLEQQIDNSASSPIKPKRSKPMAQPQPEENKLTAIEGGRTDRPKDRKIGLLPTAVGNSTEVTYRGRIVKETTWAQLKPRKGLFSPNADGSYPCFKISKSSYTDLTLDEVVTNVPVNANNKVYQVTLA